MKKKSASLFVIPLRKALNKNPSRLSGRQVATTISFIKSIVKKSNKNCNLISISQPPLKVDQVTYKWVAFFLMHCLLSLTQEDKQHYYLLLQLLHKYYLF